MIVPVLEGETVLALDHAQRSDIVRLLQSLGAAVIVVSLAELNEVLVAKASLLVDFHGSKHLARYGWSSARFERCAPRLVRVSVTTFGSGPREAWTGAELVTSAMGGVLGLTGPPERPPVKEAGDACLFHAQMVAAAGAMAALYERDSSGRGQLVDVSAQEVALSRQVNGVIAWQFDGRKLPRVADSLNYGLATVRCIWPLKDGWCFHTLMSGRFGAPANSALSAWIDEKGFENPFRTVEWAKYDRSRLDPAVRLSWERAMVGFFSACTKAEIQTDGRRRGINAAVIAHPAEVLANPQLESRRFWTGDEGLERAPSRFVVISSAGGTSRPAPPRWPQGHSRGPLHGIRVLDFSWALVGSIATKTLGDLGADVIKVESRSRPCLTRIDVQVKVSKPGHFDDKPWFAHLNTSKRSLALDLKKPQSRELLDPLIQWADVVLENFSPGTMAKLGLDYTTISRSKADIIMVSGSLFGQTGPMAGDWGVDGTSGALSARTYLTGWPDTGPSIPGSVPYGDVIVPYVMATAVPAAIHYRSRTGRGMHIDASMLEICVQQMREALLDEQRGHAQERSGNDDRRVFHQGVFPVREAGRFVALELVDEQDWLCLADFGVWSSGDRHAGRLRREELLTQWCGEQSGPELVETLQGRGIGAGMVQDIEDLLETDPQIRARGTLVRLEHPHLGTFGHLRTPITFSRTAVVPYQAPAIGEHSRSIALNIAGISAARFAELEALGVFH